MLPFLADKASSERAAVAGARTKSLSLSVLRRNFAELHPALSADEATAAAARCLYCYDAPCTRACPTRIDIPGFIRQILQRDTPGAARTILDANIFGGSCARVCPTEVLCEGACVANTLLDAPVEIGRLQRYACDDASEASLDFYEPGTPTGRRVAIVGAGPAGLTCAHELRKRGHAVDLFEAGEVAGGLNTLGIAAYKMTTEFALSEVERVLRLGAELRLRSPIDGGRLAALLEEYHAVLLAVGMGRTCPLEIPGENLAGVREALEFIYQTHTRSFDKCAVGNAVVVIGGGNTAIDAANAAARLGAARVTLAYRRDAESMPAFRHEYELALASGVQALWNARPTRILGRGGKVTGVRMQRVRMEGRGRKARLKPVHGSDFTLPCDMVIRALGQELLLDFLRSIPKLKLTRAGRVKIDPKTHATSVARLFACGDCEQDAGEEVVYAVESGKRAARGIDALLAAAPREAPASA